MGQHIIKYSQPLRFWPFVDATPFAACLLSGISHFPSFFVLAWPKKRAPTVDAFFGGKTRLPRAAFEIQSQQKSC